jgi:antitoxin PrlF
MRWGLTKGTQLKVELDGSRIILRKNVDDAVSRLRGRFKLPPGVSTDDVMRELRGRAPGDPVDLTAPEDAMIAIDSSVLIDLLGDDPAPKRPKTPAPGAGAGPVVVCDVVVSESCRAGLRRRTARHAGRRRHRLPADGPNRARPCGRARCSAATRSARRRRPPRRGPRTVPDFLIGAHALLQCTALITRDAGFFRDYFKGLKVIVPQA